jgi:predicted Rossmann fold nucleotide-binding protein DprA/Smf involved in DNA uptake
LSESGKKSNNLQKLGCKQHNYPESLSRFLRSNAPESIYAIGDLTLLCNNMTSLFSSVRCPGDLILKTYDLAQQLRDSGVTVIGGFHSPMEKDCLDILLRGSRPIIICPGRSIHHMRIPGKWQPYINKGRMLILSPFDSRDRHISAKRAEYRNYFVAALSNEIYIAYAAPRSKTMALSQKVLSWKKPVHTFNHPANQQLFEIGVHKI